MKDLLEHLAQEWSWTPRQVEFAQLLVESLHLDEVAQLLREQVERVDLINRRRGAEYRHATWQVVHAAEHAGCRDSPALRQLSREYFLPGLV